MKSELLFKLCTLFVFAQLIRKQRVQKSNQFTFSDLAVFPKAEQDHAQLIVISLVLVLLAAQVRFRQAVRIDRTAPLFARRHTDPNRIYFGNIFVLGAGELNAFLCGNHSGAIVYAACHQMIRPMLFVGGGKICLRFQVDDQAGAILRVGEQRIKLDVIQNRTLRYRFVLRVVALDLFGTVWIGQVTVYGQFPDKRLSLNAGGNLFLGAVPIFRHTPLQDPNQHFLAGQGLFAGCIGSGTVFPNRQRRVQCFIRHDVHPPPSIVFALYRKVVNFSITRRTLGRILQQAPSCLPIFSHFFPHHPRNACHLFHALRTGHAGAVGAAGQLIGIVA